MRENIEKMAISRTTALQLYSKWSFIFRLERVNLSHVPIRKYVVNAICTTDKDARPKNGCIILNFDNGILRTSRL